MLVTGDNGMSGIHTTQISIVVNFQLILTIATRKLSHSCLKVENCHGTMCASCECHALLQKATQKLCIHQGCIHSPKPLASE